MGAELEVALHAERKVGPRWELGRPRDARHEGVASLLPYSKLGDLGMQGIAAVLCGEDATFIQEHEQVGRGRGLPDDLSDELRAELAASEELAEVYCNRHDWLSLRELLDFDWEQPARLAAMVRRELASLFGDGAQPFPARFPKGESYALWMEDGVRVTWLASHRELVTPVFFDLLARLEKAGSPEEIRLVFWIEHLPY